MLAGEYSEQLAEWPRAMWVTWRTRSFKMNPYYELKLRSLDLILRRNLEHLRKGVYTRVRLWLVLYNASEMLSQCLPIWIHSLDELEDEINSSCDLLFFLGLVNKHFICFEGDQHKNSRLTPEELHTSPSTTHLAGATLNTSAPKRD